ncbi:Uncharacterised protein [Actinobaculum suis]|uniref:Uncharacterized protein n=1 Tax=Actinobaculum suis TaxID=1657 RepID=A0A7Z8Y950_9ACTO|nr:Uncharacterised protein [Actinobaculum suis]
MRKTIRFSSVPRSHISTFKNRVNADLTKGPPSSCKNVNSGWGGLFPEGVSGRPDDRAPYGGYGI